VPQDGRFRVRYKEPADRFRVSVMPTIHGEDAVLRVLDKESMSEKFHQLSLDVVGFSEHDLVKFRRYIMEPYGMVLVTGPTGSGKTTTLYAALSEIKNDEDKIITIEDPVEYQVKGITQIPVNEKKGLTFARGLRSILRHDPQDHGGRNPRPGDGADRYQLLGADRAPGVYHGSRQQCAGRAGALPEHGGGAI
jgi:type IV pilus assembly protein PilB